VSVRSPMVGAPHRSRWVLAVGLLMIVGLLGISLSAILAGPARRVVAAVPMARISVRGRRLYAGSTPWRAWGMNWIARDDSPVIVYFDHPTSAKLAGLTAQLRTAHRMGANSMRIYLELGQVMQTPGRARTSTLTALRNVLKAAEKERVYLDISGNLVWRAKRVPAWYDRLSEQSRWQVQANFWRAVAHAAASSPAVLCYELTSEPIIGEAPGYYTGRMGDWTFVQSVATRQGRDARTLARAWTRQLAVAVRSQDNRPVTIGLLPVLHDAFTPENLADLLDMLVIHQYPQQGKATEAVAVVRGYAAFKKPVLLGETFLLEDDAPTQRAFLLGANPYLVGTFEFFDGRDPNHMTVSTIPDAVYSVSLRQFIALRGALLKPQ